MVEKMENPEEKIVHDKVTNRYLVKALAQAATQRDTEKQATEKDIKAAAETAKLAEQQAEPIATAVEVEATKEKPAKAKKERKAKTEKPAQTESKSPEQKPAKFPAKGTINAYNFIRLSNAVAEAFGVQKGRKTPISIDLKEGELVIRKVA